MVDGHYEGSQEVCPGEAVDYAACDGHLRSEDELLLEMSVDYRAIRVFDDLNDLYFIYTLAQDIHLDILSNLPHDYPAVAEHMPKVTFTTVEHQPRQWVFDQRQHAFELIVNLPLEEVEQVNGAYFVEHKGKVVPRRQEDKGDLVCCESGLRDGEVLGFKVLIDEQIAAFCPDQESDVLVVFYGELHEAYLSV